jgi:RNA polymerase sigma-70 factor (ECF subfamily)
VANLKNLIQIGRLRCLSIEIVSDWREDLYQAKAAELILYGRALGLSHGEAEDVLQGLFLTLVQRPQAPANPERYCVRSFRNRALNHRRSLWRRLTRELEAHSWFEKAPAESPAERAAMRCLAELPVEQREVIVLKIWHDYTFEEIGELLDISPNTVAGRYRYGLQRIKLRLEGATDERDEPVGDAITLVGTAPPLRGA